MKVVFTNGCFDMFHEGHRYLLHEARKFGDYLIVAVDSDSRVKELKGDNRPVNRLADRISDINHSGLADAVIPFDGDVESLVSAINPDVIVKGDDYLSKHIAGALKVMSRGGSVVIVPRLEGLSTSLLIKEKTR